MHAELCQRMCWQCLQCQQRCHHVCQQPSECPPVPCMLCVNVVPPANHLQQEIQFMVVFGKSPVKILVFDSLLVEVG
eukprot:scaffold48685_cov20-Tisochrysis_lutea.AAC.3